MVIKPLISIVVSSLADILVLHSNLIACRFKALQGVLDIASIHSLPCLPDNVYLAQGIVIESKAYTATKIFMLSKVLIEN